MLELARQRDELSVVSDQLSCPTFARDLATAVSMISYGVRHGPYAALSEYQGVYHLAGRGVASRWDLVCEAAARMDDLKAKKLIPVAASTFPTKAPRPAYTALDSSRAEECFGVRLPHWRDGVRRMLGV